MKVLLHVCCGPCATYCVTLLRDKGHEVYGTFYNPNIHPYTEYDKRLKSCEAMAKEMDLPLIGQPEYQMQDFLRQVVHREQTRCLQCYYMRLKRTAQLAKKGKFDGFTTTLLISPFQDHEKIKELGENLAKEYDLAFVYYDFRKGFKESVALSKSLNLYRQQYCGCIYSEEERYRS